MVNTQISLNEERSIGYTTIAHQIGIWAAGTFTQPKFQPGERLWYKSRSYYWRRNEKRRPALIVSNDIGNENSHVVIVAPIISKVK